MTMIDRPAGFFTDYALRLGDILAKADWAPLESFAERLLRAWIEGSTLYICGNGGSAGNAMHLANDFLYGIAKETGGGMRVEALSANPAILTCLANDLGYEAIYAEQLAAKARRNDLLLVLSGSGNSPNIVSALKTARKLEMDSCAIVGYEGGQAKALADRVIHFPISDMQICEDLQLAVGHMLMQWLYTHRPTNLRKNR